MTMHGAQSGAGLWLVYFWAVNVRQLDGRVVFVLIKVGSERSIYHRQIQIQIMIWIMIWSRSVINRTHF